VHESGLFVNLALALAAAWIGAVVAVRLRQSPILGYIFAGIVIGPNTPGFVGDIHTVEDLANIGVILLMFTIGIHVSLRDLMRVSRIAVTGGVTQVLIMIGIGTIAGKLLGWGALESVFFGGVLAISSGVVMSRILGERGELGSAHGQIALGWSAVQDFATIVLARRGYSWRS
jgi:monovalent cation:H+ antiporter-2, CPA2 family